MKKLFLSLATAGPPGGWPRRFLTIALAGIACAFAVLPNITPGAAVAATHILYAGSYTDGSSKGIYAFRFDDANGAIVPLGLKAETSEPAHIWIAPVGRYLYTVNWEQPGWVSAFAIDRTSADLTFLNRVSAEGNRPNQVVVDPTGRIVVTVNYQSGSLATYRILADGRLSDAFFAENHNAPGVSGAKMHGAIFTKDGRYMFAADLGLDRVYSYRIDATTPAVTPLSPPFVALPPHSGPRRLQLSPDDRFLYVNHETDAKVSVFAVHAGQLDAIQTIATRPTPSAGRDMTSEMVLDPSGRFLYVANRGPDDISIFHVDGETGLLRFRGLMPAGGKEPRNLRIDPSGRYLLSGNQNSGTITVFAIDPETGDLKPTGHVGHMDKPGGLFFLPAALRPDGKAGM